MLERAPHPRDRSVASLSVPLPTGEVSLQGLLDVLFEQPTIGMVHLDRRGVILRANQVAARLFGLPPADLEGVRLDDLLDSEDLQRGLPDARLLLEGDIAVHGFEGRVRRADHVAVWVRAGVSALRDHEDVLVGYVVQLADVTRLRRAEEILTRRQLNDPLTGLVNRLLLMDVLGDALTSGEEPLCVISVDVDRFKGINESLGHAFGDQVLVEVGARLRERVGAGDLAARISADEFAVVYTGLGSHEEASARAEALLAAIAEPMEVDGRRIHLTASAGVVRVGARSGRRADQVLSQAQSALQQAKSAGRARYEVFDDALRVLSQDRLRLEIGLRDALDHGEGLSVAYQPIVRIADGAVLGAEALFRWGDPELGPVPPALCLPVAEETGLIVPLGERVLNAAVQDISRWRESGRPDLHVAVNLSPRQLNHAGVVAEIEQALERVDAAALRLEITESVLVEAGDQVTANLRDLRALGVQLGIDDFGTGYASMAYLKSLPVDFVKIDRSFVRGLGESREDTAIVRAVVALAQSLELATVAEGIETRLQLELLAELGCDAGQGFLLSHPLPAHRLAEFLELD